MYEEIHKMWLSQKLLVKFWGNIKSPVEINFMRILIKRLLNNPSILALNLLGFTGMYFAIITLQSIPGI